MSPGLLTSPLPGARSLNARGPTSVADPDNYLHVESQGVLKAAFSDTYANRADLAVPAVTPTGATLGVARDVTPRLLSGR